MKHKKTAIWALAILLGLTALGGLSTRLYRPVQTSAQQTQLNPYEQINKLAKDNKANPDFAQTEEIADRLIEHLFVMEVPPYLRAPVTQQVAGAYLNGSSSLNESSVAAAVNNLAAQSAAPAYAYTNAEQVKVVRTFLHGLMPDVVKISGPMDDLEAFAVYVATFSQKIDNDAFMVTPAEFTASMSAPADSPFPGTSGSVTPVVELGPESARTVEMQTLVEGFVSSKNMLESSDIVSMVGIQ
jgi:hypothetical protein